MRKIKPSRKNSFLKNILRALGVDKGSALPSLSQTETKPDDSMNYISHGLANTILLEAEQAKAYAILEMEMRRKLC